MRADQDVFDRMFAGVTRQVQAEIQLGRPWRFEAVLMSVVSAHEQRVGRW